MHLTQVNIIRGLTKAEYFQLRELCFFSNCLYNVALYNVRQKFFADKTAQIAQQTLRAVDFAFKSFFATVGKIKSAHLPHYRKKGGLFNLLKTDI